MNKERFIVMLSPTTIFCLLLLITIPFGFLLPASWGQENGPVENTQVVVILLTAFVSYGASTQRGIGSQATKLLYRWSIAFILIVAARELSWGRVFYPNGNGGFVSLSALWYGKFVYPALGMIGAGVILGIYLQKLDKELVLWKKFGKFPIIDLGIIVGCFFLADLVEHHSKGVFAQYQDLFEELFELVMYCGVLSLFSNTGFNKIFHPYDQINKTKLNPNSKTYF